jgi:hypothetical protein
MIREPNICDAFHRARLAQCARRIPILGSHMASANSLRAASINGVRETHRMRSSPSRRASNRPALYGAGVATTISDALRFNSRFDIFRFPFRCNPGTNGGNVEMGLIDKRSLVTLNQRVPGSSSGAPTIDFNHLVGSEVVFEDTFCNRFVELVRLSFRSNFFTAFSASFTSRPR